MLRLNLAIAITLGTTSAFAATFPSPPLYPSFSSPRAKIKTIEPASAAQSAATAINASGEIAGYYFDNSTGAQHGFIHQTNGKYDTFEAPDASEANGNGTAVSSLNATGVAVGNYADSSSVRHGFVRAANGTITEFDPPKSTGTYLTHINDKGLISGWMYEGTAFRPSFVRGTDGEFKFFQLQSGGNPRDTTAECINSSGAVAGEYDTDSAGFVRGPKGKITKFAPPGAVKTYVAAINDSNTVTGTFTDSSGVLHGYIRVAGGAITIVDAPGSGTKSGQGTSLQGINNSGIAIGVYIDGTNVLHAFLRGTAGAITVFDVPGAQSVSPSSIDNSRAIVGTYIENNVAHGFLRKP